MSATRKNPGVEAKEGNPYELKEHYKVRLSPKLYSSTLKMQRTWPFDARRCSIQTTVFMTQFQTVGARLQMQ